MAGGLPLPQAQWVLAASVKGATVSRAVGGGAGSGLGLGRHMLPRCGCVTAAASLCPIPACQLGVLHPLLQRALACRLDRTSA